jgi:hypothetical protein
MTKEELKAMVAAYTKSEDKEALQGIKDCIKTNEGKTRVSLSTDSIFKQFENA